MKYLRSILGIMLSNITTILSGIVIGFFVPKMLSIQDYGYYKTFTLYLSYLGMCSLGIVDGIVLKYGACNLEDLDKKRIRSYFRFLVFTQVFFMIGIVLIGIRANDTNYLFISLLLALSLIPTNVIGFFQQISQITQRFNEYSIRKVFQSASSTIFVIFFFVLTLYGHEINYFIYSISSVTITTILAIWYIITYRELVFGTLIPFKTSLVEIKDLIGLGVPLLLANLCSTLILSLDRQFVNVLFSNEEYAQYAFAYSMLSLITVATSAVSTVLYPVLKRTDDKHLKNQYDRMLSSVTVVVSVMIAAYFPLYLIIVWFLPKYSLAIAILRIIIPGIAVSSAITVVMHNYYKSFGINKVFFRKSIIILLISAAANFVAYSIWGSMEAISYASVVVIVIWYCYANSGLSNYCKSKLIKNLLYIIAVIFLFWTITEFFYNYIGFILYLCTIFIVSILFYRNYIFSVMRSLKRKND